MDSVTYINEEVLIKVLVGKINVDIRELEKRSHNIGEFLKYTDSLVPDYFKHVPAIIDNQRYLCALLIRNSRSVPWDIKTGLLNSVMCTISIVGYTSALIEVDTLLSVANRDNIARFKGRRLSHELR